MSSQRETVEIIDKLLELTQLDELSWKSIDPPYNLTSADVRVQLVYMAKYLQKNIRVYEQEYKYFVDEDKFYWQKRMMFEFVDESDNVLWTFPKTENAWDLLKAIQYKNSQVSDFYKSMFGK